MKLDIIGMGGKFHNLHGLEDWPLIYSRANEKNLGQVIPLNGLYKATWLLLVDYCTNISTDINSNPASLSLPPCDLKQVTSLPWASVATVVNY